MVSIRNIVKKYKSGSEEIAALGGISAEIRTGEFTVILGPSGSGKSTMLNMLGGMDRPTSGQILVGGEDISELSEKKLTDYRDAREGETAYILSVEGCDLLKNNLSLLETWRRRGVRMAALTWNYENCVGTPAKADAVTPLKPFGRELLRAMDTAGVIADA